MAYGVLYEFRRISTNGADMLITISQKDYNGAVKKRALGRAPVIKRENNGHIYGTSCELYAECLVDGEFSHLYTSDAYEYKVEVYKNNTLIWMGFVSPELYSEPDIAPPYDVQIIATDGLGELKNFSFQKRGVASILDHLDTLKDKTGIETSWDFVSGLRYIKEDGVASTEHDILSVKLDLDHEEGNSYYDVLQGLLSSLNANITQHNGRYLIFRETDFINKADYAGVEAFDETGSKMVLPVVSFGTMKSNQWWPVGQLSTVIEPAKNHMTLKSPNHYKENVLSFDNWVFSGLASYSEADNAYVLPGADSAITQTVDFGDHEVGYRLGLRVRARNVGAPGDEEQNIGIKVEVNGRSYSVGKTFWLVKSANTSGRPINDYLFRNTEGYIEEDLPTPTEGATSSDAQDIDIVVPLHASGSRSYVYAKNVKLTIFNPTGLYDIHVYDVSLVKYEQIKGYEANVIIENMARESESDIDLTITAGDLAPAAGDVFMTGLPMRSSDSEVITKWQIGLGQAQDYLAAMAFDYSRAISLPRMKYFGTLNVPESATILPTLFLRDGTYYFPKTYSYDLYADEITIDLISISAADVSLSSVQIIQTSDAAGTMGATTGGPAGGGGGGGAKSLAQLDDVDLSNPAVGDILARGEKEWENLSLQKFVDKYFPLLKNLGDWFYKTEDGKAIRTPYDVIIEGDLATGGQGTSQGTSGTLIGVEINNKVYSDSYTTGGILNLTEAFEPYYTKEEVDDKIAENAGSGGGEDVDIDLSDYYTKNEVNSLFTKDNIKSTLDIADWALKSSLAASDVPSLPWSKITTGKPTALSDFTNDMEFITRTWALDTFVTEYWLGNNFASLDWISNQGYATQTWVTNKGYLTSGSLSGYATQTWVKNQGYLTSNSLSGYATETWVKNQGYTTQSWVQGMGYATQTWVGNNFLALTGGKITGNLTVTGDFSTGSDVRYKDIIEDRSIDLDTIANAPLFAYKWNDREDDKIHMGTSAQYWEEHHEEFVRGEEFKTLDHATLGIAGLISLAREVRELKEAIKRLKEEKDND